MDKKPQVEGTSTEDSAPASVPPTPENAASSLPLPDVDNAPVTPPEGFVAVPADQPEKKHTPLIVAILSLIIVILVGIGAAVWYFVYYSNPEKVAYDAINGYLSQNTVVTSGLVTGRGTVGGNRYLFFANIDSKKTDGIAGENTVTLKVTPVDANGQELVGGSYEVEFSAIMLSDGVFYVQTNQLAETVETLSAEMGLTDAEDLELMTVILDLLEEVDGDWWRISVPEIVDEYLADTEIARPAKEFYACLINVANNDTNGQIAALYNDNRFINVERNADAKYVVNFDYDKMANFANSMLDTEMVSGTENCFRKFISSGFGSDDVNFDYTETDAESLRQLIGDTEVILTISDFGHELKSMQINVGDSHGNEDYFGAAFEFSHPEVTIAPPSKYRPFDELLELIGMAILEFSDIDIDSIYEDEDLDDIINGSLDDEDFWA